MHGLVFKTSISLLAGSTRYLTFRSAREMLIRWAPPATGGTPCALYVKVNALQHAIFSPHSSVGRSPTSHGHRADRAWRCSARVVSSGGASSRFTAQLEPAQRRTAALSQHRSASARRTVLHDQTGPGFVTRSAPLLSEWAYFWVTAAPKHPNACGRGKNSKAQK